MQPKAILVALLSIVAAADANPYVHYPSVRVSGSSLQRRQFPGFGGGFGGGGFNGGRANTGNTGNNNNNNNNNNANAASVTCLKSNAVQTGSAGKGALTESGQAPSATDAANFINFCSGSTLTNGKQVKTGSCNGVVMGKIPASTKMISSVLLNPKHNDQMTANTDFNVQVKINNLQAGSFTDPASTYYSAPQDVNSQGQVIGHTHITIQNMGNSLNPTTPLDASTFAFFKGINDAGQNGVLSATVTGGLPAGNYRVCTMTSSSNHQPVLMPVAQRGAQDDCQKFTVTGGGSNNNNNNKATNDNTNTKASSTTSAKAAKTSSAKKAKTKSVGAASVDETTGTSDASAADTTDDATASSSAASSAAASATSTTTPSSGSGGSGGATTNALGGIQAPAVTDSGDSSRPFSVNGNTFVNKAAAVQRACDIQHNKCADAVNGKTLASATVNDCQNQISQCVSDLS